MEQIIAGGIALIGAVVSVLVSIWTSSKNIKTEITKINKQIEQGFAQKLLEVRLQAYPAIYKAINTFI